MSESIDAWRIQVQHPVSGEWLTMKRRYLQRAGARDWLPFVRQAWHGAPVRTKRESEIRQLQARCPCASTA